jgi:hypothetical protein
VVIASDVVYRLVTGHGGWAGTLVSAIIALVMVGVVREEVLLLRRQR